MAAPEFKSSFRAATSSSRDDGRRSIFMTSSFDFDKIGNLQERREDGEEEDPLPSQGKRGISLRWTGIRSLVT
jgi:hypothetical protein